MRYPEKSTLRDKGFFRLMGQVHREVRAAGDWSSWSHPQPESQERWMHAYQHLPPSSVVYSPGSGPALSQDGSSFSVKVIKVTPTGCLLGESRLCQSDSTPRHRTISQLEQGYKAWCQQRWHWEPWNCKEVNGRRSIPFVHLACDRASQQLPGFHR